MIVIKIAAIWAVAAVPVALAVGPLLARRAEQLPPVHGRRQDGGT